MYDEGKIDYFFDPIFSLSKIIACSIRSDTDRNGLFSTTKPEFSCTNSRSVEARGGAQNCSQYLFR
jgi:hypothetical protein